jgi:hypothetical protein
MSTYNELRAQYRVERTRLASEATGVVIKSFYSLINPFHLGSVFRGLVRLGRGVKKFLKLRKKLKSQFGDVGSTLRRFGAALLDGVTGFVLKTGFAVLTLGQDDLVNLTSKVVDKIGVSSWSDFPGQLVSKIQDFSTKHPDLTARPASLRFVEDKPTGWVDYEYRKSGLLSSDDSDSAGTVMEPQAANGDALNSFGARLGYALYESALRYPRHSQPQNPGRTEQGYHVQPQSVANAERTGGAGLERQKQITESDSSNKQLKLYTDPVGGQDLTVRQTQQMQTAEQRLVKKEVLDSRIEAWQSTQTASEIPIAVRDSSLAHWRGGQSQSVDFSLSHWRGAQPLDVDFSMKHWESPGFKRTF